MGCMYAFYGDYHWQDVRDWEDELHDIVSSVPSRTVAKSMLVGHYLDTHGPFYRMSPPTNLNFKPAF